MPALALTATLLGFTMPPPTARELATLLVAADRLPTELNIRVKVDQRSRTGVNGQESVQFRYEDTLIISHRDRVNVRTVEVSRDPRTVLTDGVQGNNGEYQFQLGRHTRQAPWQLVSVSQTPNGENPPPDENFWQLLNVHSRRLAELILDDKFETLIHPTPTGVVVEGKRRDAGHGLRTYRAVVRTTPRYAFIVSSSCQSESPERYDEQEVFNQVNEGEVPLPAFVTETVRVRTGDQTETIVTENVFAIRLKVDEADQAMFRLPHYGLPEPTIDTSNWGPGPLARGAKRSDYTWIVVLVVAGVLLLLIGRWVSRRGKGSTPGEPSDNSAVT
jgi:hypothetical protein